MNKRFLKPPLSSAREVALQVVYRVVEEGAFANLALQEALRHSKLGPPDRRLATEIAYGAIKAWPTLDWALSLLLKKSQADLPPLIRCILRLGAYQLLFLDRVPPWAAINEAVELAKKYGHTGTARLVNGVLRNLTRLEKLPFPSLDFNPVRHISLKYFHPSWLVEKWLSLYGLEETLALCEADNRPAPLTLRTNTLKISRQELSRLLAAAGWRVEPAFYAPEGLVVENLEGLEEGPAFEQGYFYLQDEASMLVAHALGVRPGVTVIEACAAPGGKTTHLAQLMQNRGRIIAVDASASRLKLIEENCRRLGVTCVETIEADARTLGEKFACQADFLLVDAPCSGLGVLRRRPDARWRKEPTQLKDLPKLQIEILEGVLPCLKPGGILLYSTCSMAPEENSEVIKALLNAHPQLQLQDLRPFLPNLPADLQQEAACGQVQFYPHRHGLDGFFFARLKMKDF
ncbi:MAG: rRNA (cytosine967-C5)-methyltransferase [Clostridia bacterium]|nr:rRNA (cytosine967-C5)-methyltransferase [Clostridia bacterium]